MIYWIDLKSRRRWPYEIVEFSDSILPGMAVPERLWSKMTARVAEDLGLCEHCEMGTHCHPIEWPSGRKFCTILFHDVVKPSWKFSRVL